MTFLRKLFAKMRKSRNTKEKRKHTGKTKTETKTKQRSTVMDNRKDIQVSDLDLV